MYYNTPMLIYVSKGTLVSLLSYDAADSGRETQPDLSSLLLTPAGTNGSRLRAAWPSVHQEVY